MSRTTIRNDAVNPMKNKRLKANHLNQNNRVSQPPSPLPLSSPSLLPTSRLNVPGSADLDTQRQAQRFVLLHLLAVRPLSETAIQQKTHIPPENLSKLLQNFADKSDSSSDPLWSLSTRRFKELDVWSFPYSTADRQAAIDNAIHALDRIRLNAQDKVWQLLLPKAERNKGKNLSRLNSNSFPTDHRKFLAGTDPKSKSRQGSPSHSQNEAWEDEDMACSDASNHTKKVAKKPASKNTPQTVQKPKPNVTSSSKRKILSDEMVHSSDDDSLLPAAKRTKIEAPSEDLAQPEPKKTTQVTKKAGQHASDGSREGNLTKAKVPAPKHANGLTSPKNPDLKRPPEKPSAGKTNDKQHQHPASTTSNQKVSKDPANTIRTATVQETPRISVNKRSEKATPISKSSDTSAKSVAPTKKSEDGPSGPATTGSSGQKPVSKKDHIAELMDQRARNKISKPAAVSKPISNQGKSSQGSKNNAAPMKRPADGPISDASRSSGQSAKRPRIDSHSDSSSQSSAPSSVIRPSSVAPNSTGLKKQGSTQTSKATTPYSASKPQVQKQPVTKPAGSQSSTLANNPRISSTNKSTIAGGKPIAGSNVTPKIRPPHSSTMPTKKTSSTNEKAKAGLGAATDKKSSGAGTKSSQSAPSTSSSIKPTTGSLAPKAKTNSKRATSSSSSDAQPLIQAKPSKALKSSKEQAGGDDLYEFAADAPGDKDSFNDISSPLIRDRATSDNAPPKVRHKNNSEGASASASCRLNTSTESTQASIPDASPGCAPSSESLNLTSLPIPQTPSEPSVTAGQLMELYKAYYSELQALKKDFTKHIESGTLESMTQALSSFKPRSDRLVTLQRDIITDLKSLYNKFRRAADRNAFEILKPVSMGGVEIQSEAGDERVSLRDITAREKTNYESYCDIFEKFGNVEPTVLVRVVEEWTGLLEDQKRSLRVWVAENGKEGEVVPLKNAEVEGWKGAPPAVTWTD